MAGMPLLLVISLNTFREKLSMIMGGRTRLTGICRFFQNYPLSVELLSQSCFSTTDPPFEAQAIGADLERNTPANRLIVLWNGPEVSAP